MAQAQAEVKSVAPVAVIEYELIDKIADMRRFDALLECGHLQSIVTCMPTPPKRIVCKDCLDGLTA